MANTLKDSETNVICGLGTWTHTAASTAMYRMTAICTEVPASSVSITLSQSGSTSVSVTSAAPAASQGTVTIEKIFNCVAADVLSFAISSAAATDNQLNTVKTIVALSRIS